MFGGNIVIKSKPGEGTTTFITIPFEYKDDVSLNTNKTGENTNSDNGNAVGSLEKKTVSKEEKIEFINGKKILLVDDNSTNRLVAKGLLSPKGVSIVECDDGDKAVNIMKEASVGDFDVILMDIQMPVLNGYEATKLIRELGPGVGEVPIIALTADAFDDDRKRAQGYGMEGYVTKPFKVDGLIDEIYRVLNEK